MKNGKVKRDGFNRNAAICGPFWYLNRGMLLKGSALIAICCLTLGIAVIPVWIYSAFNGNKDFHHHLKSKGIYIY